MAGRQVWQPRRPPPPPRWHQSQHDQAERPGGIYRDHLMVEKVEAETEATEASGKAGDYKKPDCNFEFDLDWRKESFAQPFCYLIVVANHSWKINLLCLAEKKHAIRQRQEHTRQQKLNRRFSDLGLRMLGTWSRALICSSTSKELLSELSLANTSLPVPRSFSSRRPSIDRLGADSSFQISTSGQHSFREHEHPAHRRTQSVALTRRDTETTALISCF